MERTFIQTREFSKRWDELGFDDDDLRLLELDILLNPMKYPVVKGTGGNNIPDHCLCKNRKGKPHKSREK